MAEKLLSLGRQTRALSLLCIVPSSQTGPIPFPSHHPKLVPYHSTPNWSRTILNGIETVAGQGSEKGRKGMRVRKRRREGVKEGGRERGRMDDRRKKGSNYTHTHLKMWAESD